MALISLNHLLKNEKNSTFQMLLTITSGLCFW